MPSYLRVGASVGCIAFLAVIICSAFTFLWLEATCTVTSVDVLPVLNGSAGYVVFQTVDICRDDSCVYDLVPASRGSPVDERAVARILAAHPVNKTDGCYTYDGAFAWLPEYRVRIGGIWAAGLTVVSVAIVLAAGVVLRKYYKHPVRRRRV